MRESRGLFLSSVRVSKTSLPNLLLLSKATFGCQHKFLLLLLGTLCDNTTTINRTLITSPSVLNNFRLIYGLSLDFIYDLLAVFRSFPQIESILRAPVYHTKHTGLDMSYYDNQQWQAGGQPAWDQQTPPARSGMSRCIKNTFRGVG